jgi:AraC-like DNA-binding protein
MMQGAKTTGGTLFSSTDPATYCAFASAGYDFIWTEMQHDQHDWQAVSRMWRTCPSAKAVFKFLAAQCLSDAECQYAEACVIQFRPEIFGEYLLLLPELARLKSLLEVASRGVAFSHLMAAQAVPLMMRLGGESGPKRLLTLLEMLALLSRDAQSRTLCATAYHLQDSGEAKRRIETVYRYLSTHFRESCSVPEIAKAVGMNEATFSRFFRRETGRTFIEALIDLRLSYACKLLRETDKTIAEMAYDCGFSNLANFNRQFRWKYRMTPKEYRKHWAEEEVT